MESSIRGTQEGATLKDPSANMASQRQKGTLPKTSLNDFNGSSLSKAANDPIYNQRPVSNIGTSKLERVLEAIAEGPMECADSDELNSLG